MKMRPAAMASNTTPIRMSLFIWRSSRDQVEESATPHDAEKERTEQPHVRIGPLVPKYPAQNEEDQGENCYRHHIHRLKFMQNLCVVSSDKLTPKRPCPVCADGEMERLNRIVHRDNSVTTYWRCPACSHVAVKQTPAQLNRDASRSH